MPTTFWIEVTLDANSYLYHCAMMGEHFYVKGKNKSILISDDGHLLAGEISPEFVAPIFAAIQREVNPTDSAKIVSIQRSTGREH